MSLPPSSPRLPSPPPPAEIQIGPKSPSMGPHATRQAQQIEQTQIDAAAKRRIHPGTKSADMAAGPPLVPLNELDSAFQLQEHLSALHYYHTAGNTTPITRETARLLAAPPPSIDRTLWLYELCRFLIKQCNSLIVGFLFDTPPCSAATCPEMRASEWQFLCAVHDAPKSCCAIDYCCHTLDWAANVVTNPKIFPSRFVVLPDGHDRGTALKNLVNVFRRLHRIFAHAWFQHRGVFWSVEGQTGLYVFFKTVCDLYDLLPAENYKLPPEAEGLEASTGGTGAADSPPGEDTPQRQQQQEGGQQPPLVVTGIARPPSQRHDVDEDGFAGVRGTNTRRHIRSSPSTGNAVATVPEVDEDDNSAAGVASRLRHLHISNPDADTGADAEEPEVAEVPVIVMEDYAGSHYPPPPRRMSPQASAKEVDPASDSGPQTLPVAEEQQQPPSQPSEAEEVAEPQTVPEEPILASEEEDAAPGSPTGGQETETETETETQATAGNDMEPEAAAGEEPAVADGGEEIEEVGNETVLAPAGDEDDGDDDNGKSEEDGSGGGREGEDAPAAPPASGEEARSGETATTSAEKAKPTTETEPPEDTKEAKPEEEVPKDAPTPTPTPTPAGDGDEAE
ncbi:Mob1/phocein [Phialemonium atrogriseum]|uniref:Mob1/phocein n=1 Tax=Phialemonium atrogriseum TaxID=1093897 RepID=A0AAJ0C195_9PEZI|nr:Mob1/phocein [Phialemonium atrogriseum]KAK1766864.1 Mob1/phocein [Phialemonium atrogriseum]